MLSQILVHTPLWVWGLLLALVWLGSSQLFTRTAPLRRVTLLPLAMVALSLNGTVSAFGATPRVLLAWLAAGALMAWLVWLRPLPAHTRFDVATRRFTLPGSWLPLALMMGIFLTKYAVGVTLAMQPALAHDAGFTLALGTLYGAFSGVFAARSARLWRLALQHDRAPLPATTLNA